MTKTDAVNLTRIMRRDGILRICHTNGGFQVYLRGNASGTGETVGEAYQNALSDRASFEARQVAA